MSARNETICSMNETVRRHCKHKDCRYRSEFNYEPCCAYMIATGHPRNCDISSCDKYDASKIETVSTLGGVHYKMNP